MKRKILRRNYQDISNCKRIICSDLERERVVNSFQSEELRYISNFLWFFLSFASLLFLSSKFALLTFFKLFVIEMTSKKSSNWSREPLITILVDLTLIWRWHFRVRLTLILIRCQYECKSIKSMTYFSWSTSWE